MPLADYTLITSGSDCNRITSKADCDRAATQLGLADKTASKISGNDKKPFPKGCYYKGPQYPRAGLYLNPDGDGLCSCERKCLCNEVSTDQDQGKLTRNKTQCSSRY